MQGLDGLGVKTMLQIYYISLPEDDRGTCAFFEPIQSDARITGTRVGTGQDSSTRTRPANELDLIDWCMGPMYEPYFLTNLDSAKVKTLVMSISYIL